MKKLFPIMFVLAACAVDIPQDPAPSSDVIIVNFDPAATPNAIVPLPNDLAIDATTKKIVVPPTKDASGKVIDSAAQTELNTDYLGTLDGFPYESNATVTVSGDLNATTVTDQTILAFDVTAAPAPVVIKPAYANKTITVPPPAGNWLRGHRYAIAVIAGAGGITGMTGQAVLGSQTWALVSARNTLVNCPNNDLASPDCKPAVDIIPSTQTDEGAKLAEQTKLALQLETIRLGYKPILDALGAPPFNHDRQQIPIVWTFSIVNAGEMTFDPANSVIPFPNDAVRTGKGGTVALPNPANGKPLTSADCAAAKDNNTLLICGLNTLDGFSMLAPLISENSDKEGAIAQSTASKDNLIDGKSLTAKTVGLVPLQTDRPAALATAPKYTPCLNCASSKKADGTPQTSPQQLQWSLNAPLDEHTLYAGYVTNGVKDTKGAGVVANPVFALTRSANTLVDNSSCPAPVAPATEKSVCATSKSTVSLISDAQAQQLEPLRAAYKPVFDALAKGGIKRSDLALAFPFTTQSASTILDQLYGFPMAANVLLNLQDTPSFVADATALYTGAATAGSIPIGNIAKFFAGQFLTPVAVTGPAGTLNPMGAKPLPVNFSMSIPDPAKVAGGMPAGGWRIAIFGHGITRSRNDFLALANSMAATGTILIASDVVWHGDRTSCTGAKQQTGTTDDDACANPATMKCDEGFQGLCVLQDTASRMACTGSLGDPLGDGVCALAGQGRCGADKKCQGAGVALATGGSGFKLDASGKPEISGWNEFSLTNFFATRDNFRQQVIDLSRLVNLLKNTGTGSLSDKLTAANGATAIPYDIATLGYVGQSLGGILGTLFTSVSPDVQNVVLNVPGGALVQIILNAPSFATAKTALIATLHAGGIEPGTPAFDQFIGIAQWVLDEADPAVLGYRLTHGVPNGPDGKSGVQAPTDKRRALIQFIEGDETVPNISNLALVAGASRTFDPTMKPNLGCGAPATGEQRLFCYEFVPTNTLAPFDATTAPPEHRHGFLLAPPSATPQGQALTGAAQIMAAKFLLTGALQ